MALTAVLVTQAPNHLRYLLEQDGEGGQSVTISAATLLADCISGPLKEMPGIGSDVAGLTQALARRQLLGCGDGFTGATDLTNIQHAACRISLLQGITAGFGVDADIDAVNVLRCELNAFSVPGQAGFALLEIEFQHTLVR